MYVSEAYEKQQEALAYLIKCYENPSERPGLRADEHRQWTTDIRALSLASPYYWNARTINLVKMLGSDFDLTTINASRNLLHSDIGWHYFADEVPFQIETTVEKQLMPIKAITWYWFGYDGRPYLGMTGWTYANIFEESGFSTGALVPVLWNCMWEGQKMSEHIEEKELSFQGYFDERTRWEQEQMSRFVAVASTFLRQELLVATPTCLERHARKRLARAGHRTEQSTVNVIALRRTSVKSKGTMTLDIESTLCEWNWSWSVRGHVRQQWYPSLGEHLPIYIHPYLKGPVDKPLKPRTTPIYSVTR